MLHSRALSRALIIRQAITDFLKNRQQPKTIIDDKELDKLLDSCTTEGDNGFEIDAEEGFIETMKAYKFKLKDLTPKQYDRGREALAQVRQVVNEWEWVDFEAES